LSQDPKNQFILSPYLSFLNNPILLTDPKGGWVPGVTSNGTIYLAAEEGDNLKSLYDFFGSEKNAANYLTTQWTGENASKLKIVTGRTIQFNENNRYSLAMADAADPKNAGKYTPEKDPADNLKKNYNCHSCSINGSKGSSIHDKKYMDGDERNKILQEDYKNTTAKSAIFGETIITYGDNHTVVFFGRSSDGTTYVFSKEGGVVKPKITKAVNYTRSNQAPVQGDEPSYGAVGNPNEKGSASYNVQFKDVDESGREKGAGGNGIKLSNGTGFFKHK